MGLKLALTLVGMGISMHIQAMLTPYKANRIIDQGSYTQITTTKKLSVMPNNFMQNANWDVTNSYGFVQHRAAPAKTGVHQAIDINYWTEALHPLDGFFYPAMSRILTLQNLSQTPAVTPRLSSLVPTMQKSLSIVNMPVMVELSHHFQQFEGEQLNNEQDNITDVMSQPKNTVNAFNIDAAVYVPVTKHLNLGLIGQNLINEPSASSATINEQLHLSPSTIKLVAAYSQPKWYLSTDINLVNFSAIDGRYSSQSLQMDGAWQPLEWLSLKVGISQDLNRSVSGRYSVGTGLMFGQSLSIDFAGKWDEQQSIGALLRGSYKF